MLVQLVAQLNLKLNEPISQLTFSTDIGIGHVVRICIIATTSMGWFVARSHSVYGKLIASFNAEKKQTMVI